MPTSDPRNPTVRLHQSTPSPAAQLSQTTQSMLAHCAFVGSGWGKESFPGAEYLSTQTLPRALKRTAVHKRKSSGSSVASTGPPSPLDPTTAYPQIATPAWSPFASSHDAYPLISPHC